MRFGCDSRVDFGRKFAVFSFHPHPLIAAKKYTMKTPSTDLFDLIHTLTSPERAYFKRFAVLHKRASDNTYLKLFDAILQQESYDEAALKEQFKGEKLSRYFPRAKSYLYDKILEAMSLFHAEASMSIQLKRRINSARFLYSKKLFHQALKMAQQIKKDAEEWEYWAEYMAAMEIESSIGSKFAHNNLGHTDLQQTKEDILLACEKYYEAVEQYFSQREMVYLLTHQQPNPEQTIQDLG